MDKRMIYISVFVISFTVILVGIYFFIFKTGPALAKKEISLGQNNFTAEIADTFRARAQGLSGHQALGEKEGMLFLFPIKANYSFWMKGMNFPLDIIWITDNKVIGFSENVPTPTSTFDLPLFYPPSNVNSALELNAGSVKRFGINIGDELKIKYE